MRLTMHNLGELSQIDREVLSEAVFLAPKKDPVTAVSVRESLINRHQKRVPLGVVLGAVNHLEEAACISFKPPADGIAKSRGAMEIIVTSGIQWELEALERARQPRTRFIDPPNTRQERGIKRRRRKDYCTHLSIRGR